METSKFYFVDSDGPNRRAQNSRPAAQEYATAARRHVMRQIGKEKRRGQPPKRRRYERVELEWVGETLSTTEPVESRDNKQRPNAATPGRDSSVADDEEALAASEEIYIPGLAKGLGSGRLDPFLKYPLDLTPRAQRLLDYLLDPSVMILRSFRHTWYPMLWLGDISIFYQALSNTCTGLGKLTKIPELLETEAMRYHAAALETVNKNIRDPSLYNSDGVIASIIGFAFHMTQTTFNTWAVHMQGLESLVNARGGADSIRPYQLRMMLFMVDVAGSTRRDLKPRFTMPLHILPSIDRLRSRYQPSDEVLACLKAWSSLHPSRPQIGQIIYDLSIFVQWVEEESAEDPSFFFVSNRSGEWVAPILHRCLQLIPSDASAMFEPGYAMQEALRHAVILFVQSIRRKFGIVVGGLERRIEKLRGVLSECLADWTQLAPMLRWVLASGAVEAVELDDQLWFASVLSDHPVLRSSMGDDHMSALKRFIWFDGIPRQRSARLMAQIAQIGAPLASGNGIDNLRLQIQEVTHPLEQLESPNSSSLCRPDGTVEAVRRQLLPLQCA